MRNTKEQTALDQPAKDALKDWLERQAENQEHEVPCKPRKKKFMMDKVLSGDKCWCERTYTKERNMCPGVSDKRALVRSRRLCALGGQYSSFIKCSC